MKIKIMMAWMAFLLSTASAQDHAPTPPPYPGGTAVKNRAPDLAEWVVTKTAGELPDASATSANSDSTAPTPTPTPITFQDTITKSHDLFRVAGIDAQQQSWTIWCGGSTDVMVWPGGKCVQLNTSTEDHPNFAASDFPLFTWISAEKYTGMTDYKGIKCIVYDGMYTVPGGESMQQPVKAYVDLKTRLPVAVSKAGYVYTYVWNPPPTGPLSLPPEVTALINRDIAAKKQMAQGAVAPY